MIVTLDEVKAQLNQTLAIDDALITRKAAAAQSHLENLLGFKIEDAIASDPPREGFEDGCPAALIECICLLAAHWYENREAALVGVNAQSLPFGIDDIVNEFRNWSWGEPDAVA